MKPIEYIGTKPRKKKSRGIFGGWVIVLLAVGVASFFGMQFSHLVSAAENKPNAESADLHIVALEESRAFGPRLAASALKRSKAEVMHDESYYSIAYPNGDISPNKGMSADLVIRSYRERGIDLQKLVHEDMQQNFRLYPQIWNAHQPDTNIDHRRVPNLLRFFSRHGKELKTSRRSEDYHYGDVVAWYLNSGSTHIGIVVPGPGEFSKDKWVVHNVDNGPVWEEALFDFEVIGHYRYAGPEGAE